MELGRAAIIDQAQSNNIVKNEKVNEIKDSVKVDPDDKYKNAGAKKDNQEYKNEVTLDNIKFGYNKDSKDFYVKVQKGDLEYKYPTEDMMRLKAFLIKALENKEN
jgi:ABC-type bacteriocin/lantibiotic exporter with double-glycine peptidase domain